MDGPGDLARFEKVGVKLKDLNILLYTIQLIWYITYIWEVKGISASFHANPSDIGV